MLILEPTHHFNGDEKKLVNEALELSEKSQVTDSIKHFLIHKSLNNVFNSNLIRFIIPRVNKIATRNIFNIFKDILYRCERD